MLKNKFFTVLLMCVLALPVFAEEDIIQQDSSLTPITQEYPEEVVQDKLPNLDTIPYKKPASKKKIVKQFLLAMGGVAVSSILLYILLTIYNNAKDLLSKNKNNSPENKTSLETPDNLDDAVKIFLEKTNWS